MYILDVLEKTIGILCNPDCTLRQKPLLFGLHNHYYSEVA